jgi:hypothetical protein
MPLGLGVLPELGMVGFVFVVVIDRREVVSVRVRAAVNGR